MEPKKKLKIKIRKSQKSQSNERTLSVDMARTLRDATNTGPHTSTLKNFNTKIKKNGAQ